MFGPHTSTKEVPYENQLTIVGIAPLTYVEYGTSHMCATYMWFNTEKFCVVYYKSPKEVPY